MATLDDLRALGYDVGVAHGSVEVEEQALAAAKEAADPNVVSASVNQLTVDTVQTLSNLGKLPEKPEERHELATRIAEDALALLTEAVTERVAFHERAVQIAKDSPDVWVIRHFVGDVLSAQQYVAATPDGAGWDPDQQALLDSLGDPVAYAEREWQVRNQDALAAAATLTANGRVVERGPGETSFTVDGKAMTCKQIIAAAAG